MLKLHRRRHKLCHTAKKESKVRNRRIRLQTTLALTVHLRRDSTPPHETQQAILDQSHTWRVPTPSNGAWTNNTVQRPPAPPRVQSSPSQSGSGQTSGPNGYALENQSHSSGSPPTGDGRLWQDLQPGPMTWDPSIVDGSSASCDFSHLTDLDDIFTFTGNTFMPGLPPTQPTDFLASAYPQQNLSPQPLLPPAVPSINGNHIPPRRSSAVHIPGINPRDQEYLRVEGCFNIPPPHVLRIMMRMYFRMVHPNLTIIPENEFWALWTGDEFRAGEYSLLLLRAMIFAATCYTELDILSSLGFVSKREARNTHYRQAKVWAHSLTKCDEC